ncbi:MAG: 2-oxoacid:acceptor oxidoreductase family protein [Chloroflexi bacterium]|nr:2-oxoacid:acceptor oxidoreductase family protein [Chloroflexota bacterium]
MIEIRMLGRGGQGAYISAEMLAAAFVREGKYATAFPMFGGERRGAPVNVFVRFDNKPIRLRSQIYYPNCCIVTDPLLGRSPDALKGLRPGGVVVMNQPRMPEDKPHQNTDVLAIVDATGIALEETGRPITNTVMLGALIKATNWVKLESILEAFKSYFSDRLLESNIRCVKRGMEETQVVRFGGK